MKSQKTWHTIHFYTGDAEVEATLNYKTKKFSLTHSNNDENVTFGKDGESISTALQRARCVMAALQYIKKELTTPQPPTKKEFINKKKSLQ